MFLKIKIIAIEIVIEKSHHFSCCRKCYKCL